MKQFNLDEYLKNPSRKVVTRDGRNARIYCTNFGEIQPIIAEVEGMDYSESFTEYGKYYTDHRESKRDLFFAPEKHEGWINIFKSSNDIAFLGQSLIFESKEDAENSGKGAKCYVDTIKIEWEE